MESNGGYNPFSGSYGVNNQRIDNNMIGNYIK
jgi:hypothetical protein